MKLKTNIVFNDEFKEDRADDRDLKALLELLKKQFELDKKLYALLTLTTGE